MNEINRSKAIYFVVNASISVGGGHLLRCLTLAAEIQNEYDRVVIFHGFKEGSPLLKKYDFDFVICQNEGEIRQNIESMALAFISNTLVVDHYGLDVEFEEALRPYVDKIVVIDDLANRPHDCDIVVDQNIGTLSNAYDGLVPSQAVKLIGPKFALLRPEFSNRSPKSAAGKFNIHVSFGFTDPDSSTLLVLDALKGIDCDISVAIGSSSPAVVSLRRAVADYSNIELFVDCDSIGNLLARADLAVGAGGSSCWERCAMGVPSLVTAIAENQRENVFHLHQAGAAEAFDLAKPVALKNRVQEFIDHPHLLEAMKVTCGEVCDGKGAEYVANQILKPVSPVNLSLVPKARYSTDLDRFDVWFWRNDSQSRSVSGSSDPISWDEHVGWWSGTQDRDERHIVIIEVDTKALGYVRFSKTDGESGYIVSIAVSRNVRGKGLSKAFLRAALLHFSNNKRGCSFIANIQSTNIASRKLFENCGFENIGQEGGAIVMRLLS